MNRVERQRHEYALLLTAGLYHTSDQWTRVLTPFIQWELEPHLSPDSLLWLTATSTLFSLIGTVFIAQMIEAFGLRKTAVISSCVVAIFQIVVGFTRDYYTYLFLQTLLIFNNMPMIIDAAVLHLEGEDGDDKKRTRLITKILIPTSIGFAAGPYCALQMIFFVTPSLELSQSICSVLTIFFIIPLVVNYFPDSNCSKGKSFIPDLRAYGDLLKNERTVWCTILIMLISAPYATYDNVIRITLASTALRDPRTIHTLFLILGITTMIVNAVFLPKLQTRFAPQFLLKLAFAILTISYIYLAIFRDYTHLLFGMPLQVIGVTIGLGEVSSQLMGTIGRGGAGKAAALIRISQLLAGILIPFIVGSWMSHIDSTWLCVASAGISIIAIGLVEKYGSFMKFNAALLPGVLGKFE
ncbi:unnamed protein product [Caenorhabditis bovis]|uniref:Uncharacterized protein n=1 Tax=Caenorhabditis bovis TaxID=2654633 RepID=A0A8S1FFV2_9PELO|nr:unnamed protein product [Caenorhabditis bovis]